MVAANVTKNPNKITLVLLPLPFKVYWKTKHKTKTVKRFVFNFILPLVMLTPNAKRHRWANESGCCSSYNPSCNGNLNTTDEATHVDRHYNTHHLGRAATV